MKTVFLTLSFTLCFFFELKAQSTWKPLPDGGTNEVVLSIYSDSSGYVWVTGFFTQAGALSVNYVARHNGLNWMTAGDLPNTGFGFIRYHDTLFIYGGFMISGINYGMLWWNGNNWQPFIEISFSGYINTASIYQGDLVVGGKFTSLAGNASIKYLAKYKHGSWNKMFSAISAISSPEVYSLYADDVNIYVGGQFEQIENTYSPGVIKWNGTYWQSIQTLPSASSVKSINEYSDTIIVAGDFFIPTSRNVVKLADTTCLNLSNGTKVAVQSSEIFNSLLFLGGSTTFGASLPNIISWDGLSLKDESVGVRKSKSETIYTIERGTFSDVLYIGGTFSTSLGDTADYIAYRGTLPIPLPVELSEFHCSIEGERVALVWHTASESNNEKFEIEKSVDGSTFIKVAEISGSGTSNQMHQYYWVDSSYNIPGLYYFRLKQIDFDGTSTYSDICQVSFASDKNSNIFPNPFKEELMFQEPTTGTLYNALGQKVLEIFHATKINTTQLPRGSYYFISEKGDPVQLVK